jgi:hypothetical protein
MIVSLANVHGVLFPYNPYIHRALLQKKITVEMGTAQLTCYAHET